MSVDVEHLKDALGDRYEIERELGQGGMATVYLARDLKHDRQVAIKVLKPDLAAVIGAERFLAEIRTTANLQHPHILPLFDSGEAGSFLFYVMPLVGGESLRTRLKEEKQLGLEESLRIVTQVAQALDYAHRQGVLHRDIKPENILLQEDQAVVADFGISLAVSAAGGTRLTETGMSIGTPQYMSPEQATGDRSLGPASDIYSLACILYEMLSGDTPHAGSTAQAILVKVLTESPTRLSLLRDTVPPAVEAAVHTALAKTPADRFDSAADFALALEGEVAVRSPFEPAPSPKSGIGSGVWKLALAGATVLLLAFAGWMATRGDRDAIAAETLYEIERLAEEGAWEEAYALTKEADNQAPNDSAVQALWPLFSWRMNFSTEPPGATVYRKAYRAPEDAWEVLGTTPLDSVPFPFGLSKLRFELEGYRPAVAATAHWLPLPTLELQPDSSEPDDFIWIPGWTPPDLGVELGPYRLGRYEVTNREYKEFVDAGGYEKRGYWTEPFVENGREISWEEAMARFVDRTGQPGPSTWEVGDYLPNQGEHPVAGISWYEAAAYAEFAGADLPTIHHWYPAAYGWAAAWIVPGSNFDGSGTAAVGQYAAIARYGNLDMAGNVREWCYNEADGERYLLGGGWNDAEYQFPGPTVVTPFDRSTSNGFRLIEYLDETNLDRAREPAPLVPHTYGPDARPVSDEVFAVYRQLYEYDRIPLDPQVVEADTARDWIREKITLDASFMNERMIVYLYLPKTGQRPLQTVVYWPGSNARWLNSIDEYRGFNIDFVVRSGRALLFPVLTETFERRIRAPTDVEEGSIAYRDIVIEQVKQIRLALDLVEHRADLDETKIAYYGWSWGGQRGPIPLAVDPRLRIGILEVAGLRNTGQLPQVEPFNFVTRVTQPVLMLNGIHDRNFPYEDSALPLYRMLGTPDADKRLASESEGHNLPRNLVIRETLAWLDERLGRVER
jgi:tRNA A-37 threonylcarbamoyl transferase component Bud32